MRKTNYYISFFETKKFSEFYNIEFIKNVKYAVHSETPTAYILKNGIEINKDKEGILYSIGAIERGDRYRE